MTGEVTCRFCRETVTPNAAGELENSEGKLACPAEPDSYHQPEEEPDAHECAACGVMILPVGSETWVDAGGVLTAVCSTTCDGEG